MSRDWSFVEFEAASGLGRASRANNTARIAFANLRGARWAFPSGFSVPRGRRQQRVGPEAGASRRGAGRGGTGAPTQFLLFWYPTCDSG